MSFHVCEVTRVMKFTETESRTGLPEARGGRNRELVFQRCRVQLGRMVCDNVNVTNVIELYT